MKACQKCPALGIDHVCSIGTPSAQLMIIGQSPGEREVEEGEPFVGPAGDILNALLTELLLARDEVYIANVLKCRPMHNRRAYLEERKNCLEEFLREEISTVDPRVILLLGRDAYETVLPEKVQLKHPFAQRLLVKSKARAYVVSYHPAYFLHKRMDHREFLRVAEVIEDQLKED